MLETVCLNQPLVLGLSTESGPVQSNGIVDTPALTEVIGLTPSEVAQLQNDFVSISSNGDPDHLEGLFVRQFLRSIILGERKDISAPLQISDESLGILRDRYVEGKEWNTIGKDLKPERENYDGRRNANSRGKLTVTKIVSWLTPLGAQFDVIKEILNSLSKVKIEAKQKLKDALIPYQKWLESFNLWLKGAEIPKPITFNLQDKEISSKSALLKFIEQLKIKLHRGLTAGQIKLEKSELGFVLDLTSNEGINFHRYLMAPNSGELLEPPKKYSRYKFLDDRTGWRFDIYKLLWRFGPVDLNRALHPVKIFFQEQNGITFKHLDLRLHQDNFGSQIPIPINYIGESLKPSVLPEDLEKGIKRVTFSDPDSGEPVVEVILTYTDRGYESSYLGKYAEISQNSGSLKKATKDTNEFLSGERSTPPKLQKLKVHRDSSSRFIFISHQRISLTEYLPEEIDEVKLVFGKTKGIRFLRLYKPDAEPNTRPLVTLKSNNGVIEIVGKSILKGVQTQLEPDSNITKMS